MKAGKDIDGLWTLLESTIWYVLIGCGDCVLTCPSITAVTSHVSWVVPLFMAVATKKSTFIRSQGFCKEWTLKRLRMGANRRDLFYYLVSHRIIFSVFFSDVMIEWRRTP
jgi:hypothetical protein